MNKLGVGVIGSLGVAVLAAGAPLRGGMVGMQAADPAIAKVQEAYRSAVVAGDAAAVAAVFREDAVEMPPSAPPVRGRTAIEGYYRGMFTSGTRFASFDLTPSEVRVAGDVAYIVGTSRQQVAASGSAPVACAGKYLVVLKREREGWKVAYAIYNTDAPMGPAPH